MSVKKPYEPHKIEPMEKNDIERLITKGASVKQDALKKDKEWKLLNLRLSAKMLESIDKAVSESVGITRTGWILQAIDEKLKRL